MKNIFAQKFDNKYTGLPDASATSQTLATILQLAFGVAAAIAVLSIVIAAFNFATANGDGDKISRSKRAIAFALIGLAIAMLGQAIVFVVVKQI
jgi:hypothetical protein